MSRKRPPTTSRELLAPGKLPAPPGPAQRAPLPRKVPGGHRTEISGWVVFVHLIPMWGSFLGSRDSCSLRSFRETLQWCPGSPAGSGKTHSTCRTSRLMQKGFGNWSKEARSCQCRRLPWRLWFPAPLSGRLVHEEHLVSGFCFTGDTRRPFFLIILSPVLFYSLTKLKFSYSPSASLGTDAEHRVSPTRVETTSLLRLSCVTWDKPFNLF